MPCYHPIPAWYAPNNELRPGRTLRIIFKPLPDHLGQLQIPCGRCIGCKLEHSRQWAIRCMHEAQLYQHNHFVTLTYDNDNLPPGGSLQPRDFVLFMKRLRKAIPERIRYYQAGEYGENLSRPHHHALLFNTPLHDLRMLPSQNNSVHRLFRSRQLESIWGKGLTTIGPVNFETAAYVARYCTKKISGPDADAHYQGRLPEYATMSRRPGIGQAWLNKYKTDVYPQDTVTLRGGIQTRPPRYYDKQLPVVQLRYLKLQRRLKNHNDPDSTGRRLIEREQVKTSAINLRTTRSYEK